MTLTILALGDKTYHAPYQDPSGFCFLCTYLMALSTHEL